MAEAQPDPAHHNLDVEAVVDLDGTGHVADGLPEMEGELLPEGESSGYCINNDGLYRYLKEPIAKLGEQLSGSEYAELLAAQDQLELAASRLRMYGAIQYTLTDCRTDLKKAKENAEVAYHKCSNPVAKAHAVRIVSIAVVYLNYPDALEFAAQAAIGKLEKLHELPDVQAAFTSLTPQPNWWPLANPFAADPKDIVRAVCQVNVDLHRLLFSGGLVDMDFEWPCVNTTTCPLQVAYDPRILPQTEPLTTNTHIPGADLHTGIKDFSFTGKVITAVTSCQKMVVKLKLEPLDTEPQVIFRADDPFCHAIEGSNIYCFSPVYDDTQGLTLEGHLTTITPDKAPSQEWISIPLPAESEVRRTKVVHMSALEGQVRFIVSSYHHAMTATYDTTTKVMLPLCLRLPAYMLPLKEGQCCFAGEKVYILYLNTNHGDSREGRIHPGLYIYDPTEGQLNRDDHTQEKDYRESFDGHIEAPSPKHLLLDLLKDRGSAGVKRSLIALDVEKLDKLMSSEPTWRETYAKCCMSPDTNTFVLSDNNYLSVWDLSVKAIRSIRYKSPHDDRIKGCIHMYNHKHVLQAFENTLEVDKIQIVT